MLSLADAILQKRTDQVLDYLHERIDLNQLDEYGFTFLIEAAIANEWELARLLIENGADVNLQDSTGGTALHWAAENNNLKLARLLLEKGANPNAYSFSGQPVLVMPLLRQQKEIKNLLIEKGASLEFAQDYINAKLLGHMFELVGTVYLIDPSNQFVELDFEGFFLEFSLAIIAESLGQFRNHFAARHLRRYGAITSVIVEALERSAKLIKYHQYLIDYKKYSDQIDPLLAKEPLIIPVGYEGHAITFIKMGQIFVKCDRREDSRLYDNVMFYEMGHPENFTYSVIKNLIYDKQSSEFINNELHHFLDLKPITELKVPAQISGNCSWANVEACVPALFFLLFSGEQDFSSNLSRYKNMALKFFHEWREWNRDRALNFCIQSFHHADSLRKACKAEILGAILFQSCKWDQLDDRKYIEAILDVLTIPRYEHILQNYIKSYVYEDMGEEGKNFMKLLKTYGYMT